MMEAFCKNIAAKFGKEITTNNDTKTTMKMDGNVTQETTRGNLSDPINSTMLKKPEHCRDSSSSYMEETTLASCRSSNKSGSRRPSRDHIVSGRSSRRPSADNRAEMSGNFILSAASPAASPRCNGKGFIDCDNVSLLVTALQKLKETNGNVTGNNSSPNDSKKDSSGRGRTVRSGI